MRVQKHHCCSLPPRRAAEFSPANGLCCQAGDGRFSTECIDILRFIKDVRSASWDNLEC
jgi:hypothetical protein